jgi:hypothetical protein
MAEKYAEDLEVEETSLSADVTTSIHHETAETTSDGAYVVDTKLQSEGTDASSSDGEVKVTKDGKISLTPQPSDDPADPLNWSWSKKHMVLIALTFSALLTDWGMTWGTTLFEAQAQTWGMSVVDISNSLSGGIFLQGPGGILAVPLVQRYGRLVAPIINVLNANVNISVLLDCQFSFGPRFCPVLLSSELLRRQPMPGSQHVEPFKASSTLRPR